MVSDLPSQFVEYLRQSRLLTTVDGDGDAASSQRYLRETMVFPYRSSDGHAVLAVADPSDMTARRAAQIVLGAGSHGGKLSDVLSVASSLPPMAVRMLRLGEETGQLPALAARVAEFYEAELQRNLDCIVGIVGPLAIVIISTVVGGLIVSVMTALLSVTQLVN
jgi:hypothetical protein